MKIRRGTSGRTYIDPRISDAHIEAAIADPNRVVQSHREGVYRIVGLAALLEPTDMILTIADRSLLNVTYLDRGDEVLVLFAAEADMGEDLRQWIEQTSD